MANYHLEARVISRGKGGSIAERASYITGQPLHDLYKDKNYSFSRDDVLFKKIFVPAKLVFLSA